MQIIQRNQKQIMPQNNVSISLFDFFGHYEKNVQLVIFKKTQFIIWLIN